MGLEDPGPPPTYYCVNRSSENAPIDFIIFVGSLGVTEPYTTQAWFYGCGTGDWGGVEWLKIWYDTDADDWYDDTHHEVGALSYTPDRNKAGCGWWSSTIANNWVEVGDPGNLFQISLTDPANEASCLAVREGGLYMEEVTEFVPEAGSILLLGSGLVGLAGYATLRWRARR
jgi:hypothetical protein